MASLFRERATAELLSQKEQGRVVVLVSATFEPIVSRAMEFHPIDFQISTRMRAAKDGTYTCEVEGLPVEGDQKIVRLREFADERFGAGPLGSRCRLWRSPFGPHASRAQEILLL